MTPLTGHHVLLRTWVLCDIAVNLTLLGRDYLLYFHVHHPYKLNDAFDRSVAYLLSAQMTQHLGISSSKHVHLTFTCGVCDACDAVNLTLLGRNYSLYTHVHHTYGLNDAFDRSVAYLLSAQTAENLDSGTEALLEESVLHKPLDQDDTVNTAADPTDTDTQTDTGRRKVLQGLTDQLRSKEHSPAAARNNPEFHQSRSKFLQKMIKGHGLEAVRELNHDSIQSRRSLAQNVITVEHPCLHQGYSREYTWVAHGAHVTPLPQVQLLGR